MAAPSNWLLPTILAFGCLALMVNVYTAKKASKALIADVDAARADLRVAMDKHVDCSKELEKKSQELRTKDEEIQRLNTEMGTLNTAKADAEGKLTQLNADLKKAQDEKAAVQAELDKAKGAAGKKEEAAPAAEEKKEAAPAA